MKKILLFLCCFTLLSNILAQNNPPTSVSAVPVSHSAIRVSWNVPAGTTVPTRMDLFNSADMVTHPGASYNGADVSALYGGQQSLGYDCVANPTHPDSSYWVADDFTLSASAVLTGIDFYAYKTAHFNNTTFTGCYVRLYNQRPSDPAAVPIWSSDTMNCLDAVEWSGIYRTLANNLLDTSKPIMKISANVNVTLPAGTYWVAVSLTTSAGTPWLTPRADLNALSTGNAIQYNPLTNLWKAMADVTSLEQMGLPLTVRGEFVADRLSGFNIYRDNILLNTRLEEGFSFLDTGLTEITTYCYRVEAVYATGSPASSQSVCATTNPAPVDSCQLMDLPLFEYFDGHTTGTGQFDIPCWYRYYSSAGTDYPYLSNAAHFSGDASVYMTTNAYIITPPLWSDSLVRDLTVEFMLKKSNSTATVNITIGSMTNPSDIGTFTPIMMVTPAANTNWQKATVSLGSSSAVGRHIALKAFGNVYLDNFGMFLSDCMYPTNVSVSSITAYTAQLSWNNTGVPSYSLRYRPVGEETWIEATGIQDTFYVISGLNAGTYYNMEVQLRADCGNDSYYTTLLTFETACLAVSAPYVEDFDRYPGSSTTNGWFLPTCWTRLNSNANANYPYINQGSSNAYSGNNYVYFYTGASTTSTTMGDNYAILPQFSNPIQSLELSLMAREANTSSMYVGSVKVGVMTDPMNLSSFTTVDTIAPTTTTYEPFTVSFANYTGPDGFIALKAQKPLSGFNLVYVDNVVVAVAGCSAPLSVAQTAGTDTSITCTWHPDPSTTALSYTLAYLDNSNPSAQWVEVTGLTDTTYTVSGLEPDNTYIFKVKTVCPNGESAFSFDETFRTLCATSLEIPYSENFDMMQDLSFMDCWLRPINYVSSTLLTFPSVYLDAYQAHSGEAALRFTHQVWAVTPPIAENIENLTLNLWAKAYNASSGRMEIGVMSNPFDTSTFELVHTVNVQALNTYEFVEIRFDSVHTTGPNRYIAFRLDTNASSAYYLDDINIIATPTCPRPTDIVFYNISPTSASATWSSAGYESHWRLRYKPKYGDNTWIENNLVLLNQFDFLNLMPSTAYVVQVQADCNTEGWSDWSIEYEFMTDCGEISSLPYLENFDTYGWGSGSFPTCWTHGSDLASYSFYPYLDGNTRFSMPASMNFYSGCPSGSACGINFAATPRIADNISIPSLAITFRARSSSNSSWMQIGFMADSMDVNTFTPYDTIQISTAQTWEEFYIDFSNYADTGRFIAFKFGGGDSPMSMFIDNFALDYKPLCIKPSALTIDSLSQTSISLSWVPGAYETAWVIAYKEDTASQWIETPVLDTFYIVDGLTVGTTYQIKVKSDCVFDGESNYTDILTTTTLCNAITTIPYIEDFSDVPHVSRITSLPPCWNKYYSGIVNNYPYVSTATADVYSAPGALYCYATSAYFDMAIMPELDGTIDLNSLKLSCKAKITNAGNKVQVGIMDNPMNPNSFVQMGTIAPSSTGVWEDFGIYFATYSGQGRFIAFRCGDGQNFNTVRIDNIVLDQEESCHMPLGVTAQNVLHSSAEISWVSTANISMCEYVFGLHGLNPDTASISLTYEIYTPLSLINLEPNTTYDFYVRNICPDGSRSPWSSVCTFTTTCTPMSVPYVQSFDNDGYGVSVLPGCWNKLGSGTAYINNNGGYSGHYLYASTSITTDLYMVLPELDADVNILQLNFFCRFSNLTYRLEIGVMSDPADTTTFTPIETVNARTTVWNEFHIPLTAYTGTGKFIVLRSSRRGMGAYIDNLSVTYAPGCVRPANITATDMSTTHCTLTWRKGSTETLWEVAYGPAGFDPDIPIAGAILDRSFEDSITLTGLTPATYYDIYVRSVCDSNEFSDWSQVYSMRTDCEPITALPYTQNFDQVLPGNSPYPLCWERKNTYSTTTEYPYVSNGGLYFTSAPGTYVLATTPQFDMDVQNLHLLFDFRAATPDYNIIVGVMNDPFNINTFTAVDTINSMLPSIFESKHVFFGNYSGNGHYIALLSQIPSNYNYTNYVYIDNVVIDTNLGCFKPENLMVTEVTGNSVTLDWDNTLNLTNPIGYTIRYAEDGTGSYTYIQNVASAPYTVTGLQAGVRYFFEVSTRCSAADMSDYSDPVTAHTICAAQTVPYRENFDSLATTATYLTGGALPDCWQGYSTYWAPFMQPHIVSRSAMTTNAFPNSQPNCLLMQALPTDTTMVVLPLIDQPLYNVRVAFTKRMSTSTETYVLLEAGYATDPNDMSTFVPVAVVLPSLSIEPDTVSFQNAVSAPANARMAFRWSNTYTQSATMTHRCCLDDISVEMLVDCAKPDSLRASNITSNGAVITWDGFDATQWQIEYRPAGNNSWVTLSVTNPSCTLTNLVEETTYQVRVRAKCLSTLYSVWSDIFTFTTSAADVCLTPTNLAAGTPGISSVTLTWDVNNAISWNLRYKKANSNWIILSVTTNQYTLSNLDAESSYTVSVQAVCGSDFTSDWSADVSFTTAALPICLPPTGLAVAPDVDKAAIVWTASGDENTWGVRYKNDASDWSDITTVTSTSYVIRNLTPSTHYTAQVISICDVINSDAASIEFTTLPNGIADYELTTTLYPNPNNGQFIINNEQLTIKNVDVYDVYGKLLKSVEANANTVELDVRELSAGMYFVRISTEKGTLTRNFVKK